MWVKFKVRWQDGLYKYTVGKVADLPTKLAEGYCLSGKAEPCKPPKWAVASTAKKKKDAFPSARRRIKKSRVRAVQQESFADLACELGEDD